MAMLLRFVRLMTVVVVLMGPGVVLAACSSAGVPEETYSAAEREEMKQQWAEFYQITDPPDVAIVREVDTSELSLVKRSCMEEQGFPTKDGVGWNISKVNMDNFRLAQYICAMKYPIPKKYAKPWGEEQIRIQYVWTRDFEIPCLEYFGHPITGLPSEKSFIESWNTDSFYPFSQITLNVPDEEFNQAWDKLEQTCMQTAPGPVLWEGMSVDEWKRLHPYETEGASTPPQ